MVLGLLVSRGQVRSEFATCLARSDLGSLRALQVGLVRQSSDGTMPASGRAHYRWSREVAASSGDDWRL